MPIVIDNRTGKILGQHLRTEGETLVFLNRHGSHRISTALAHVEVIL